MDTLYFSTRKVNLKPPNVLDVTFATLKNELQLMVQGSVEGNLAEE